MAYRMHTLLVLSSCLMGGLLTACDAPDDEPSAEIDENEVVAEAESAAKIKAKTPTKRLVREWTRWAMELPWSTGPINDPTGAMCGEGQEGPVWFLAGTSGGAATRECDIPAHKQLFFPLVNRFCMFPPEFYPDQASIDADLPAIAEWYDAMREHTCTLTLRIDGQDVFDGGLAEMDDELYVETSNLFEVDLNTEDNFLSAYGVAGGSMPASSSGHFARIKALPPGDHVLELGGSTCDGDELWFETSVTYHLHVAE